MPIFFVLMLLLSLCMAQDGVINLVTTVNDVALRGCDLSLSKNLTIQLINETNARERFVFMEPLILNSPTWNMVLSPDFVGVAYLQRPVKISLEHILSSSLIYQMNLTKAFVSFADQYILWKGFYLSRCARRFDFPANGLFERGVAIEVVDADKWEREFDLYGRGLWKRSGNSFYYTGVDVVDIQPKHIYTFQMLYNGANQFTPINITSGLDISTINSLETSDASGLASSIDPTRFWIPFSRISETSANQLTLYLGVFVPMATIGVLLGSILILNRRTLWTRDDLEHWKDKHYNDLALSVQRPLKRLTRYVDNDDNEVSEETVFNYFERVPPIKN